MNDGAIWPSENIARAKYYMSRVLKQRDPNNRQAAKLEQEAYGFLQQKGLLGRRAAYDGDYAVLFDFIVPWECRLITPRKGEPSELSPLDLLALVRPVFQTHLHLERLLPDLTMLVRPVS